MWAPAGPRAEQEDGARPVLLGLHDRPSPDALPVLFIRVPPSAPFPCCLCCPLLRGRGLHPHPHPKFPEGTGDTRCYTGLCSRPTQAPVHTEAVGSDSKFPPDKVSAVSPCRASGGSSRGSGVETGQARRGCTPMSLFTVEVCCPAAYADPATGAPMPRSGRVCLGGRVCTQFKTTRSPFSGSYLNHTPLPTACTVFTVDSRAVCPALVPETVTQLPFTALEAHGPVR